MAKVVLSKSGLQKERENLKLYRKVLPSLDLKRRQLMGEQKREEKRFRDLEAEFERFPAELARDFPMLGAEVIDFTALIRVSKIREGLENVVGVKLPVLDGVEFDQRDYSLVGTPHWVDPVIARLRDYAERRARYEIGVERIECLRQATRKITQRVNLFERILIPTAESNIKRIQIHLADAERAGVVQSKLAKRKNRERRLAHAAREGGRA